MPFSKLYEEADIFVPIYSSAANYRFFDQSVSLTQEYAPYISSLFTPLFMKGVNLQTYVDTILTDNRKVFNSAFTLPTIDKKS